MVRESVYNVSDSLVSDQLHAAKAKSRPPLFCGRNLLPNKAEVRDCTCVEHGQPEARMALVVDVETEREG